MCACFRVCTCVCMRIILVCKRAVHMQRVCVGILQGGVRGASGMLVRRRPRAGGVNRREAGHAGWQTHPYQIYAMGRV